ncbi:VOC family protein [Roseomonas sp. KE2513]|uniref:VOC family protein n=1 Tax=Roseomonas sp. KE2513 TaxID=2479202 RepID=UPI0018E05326|nr:VOC family protein [Roseomonas sp. KE2513]MBI0537916.1 VOC family protein [Roseomonas sp. KE2513]
MIPRLFLLLLAVLLSRAAWRARPIARAERILRVSRVVSDLDRTERFYRDGLGFRTVSRGAADPSLTRLLGFGDLRAEELVMRLGAEEVALVRFERPSEAYPARSRSDDAWFQHLAIVAHDMAAAAAVLLARSPATISSGGPQRLPPRNGSVEAFKFRDPDGHPLELIHFPPGQGRPLWQGSVGEGPFLGIDHSAIGIASTARSRKFYGRLGFRVAGGSHNHGAAQAGLDGLADPDVLITALRPHGAEGPGLELLEYRPPGRQTPWPPLNSLATDWVTISVRHLRGGTPLTDGRRALALRDPDGHRLLLIDQRGGTTAPASGPAT